MVWAGQTAAPRAESRPWFASSTVMARPKTADSCHIRVANGGEVVTRLRRLSHRWPPQAALIMEGAHKLRAWP